MRLPLASALGFCWERVVTAVSWVVCARLERWSRPAGSRQAGRQQLSPPNGAAHCLAILAMLCLASKWTSENVVQNPERIELESTIPPFCIIAMKHRHNTKPSLMCSCHCFVICATARDLAYGGPPEIHGRSVYAQFDLVAPKHTRHRGQDHSRLSLMFKADTSMSRRTSTHSSTAILQVPVWVSCSLPPTMPLTAKGHSESLSWPRTLPQTD